MGISLNPATILSGQGIDVTSLVQQILNSQSGVLTEWQSEASALATQAGLLAGFNNNLTNLATSVSVLADPNGALVALTATSSEPSAVTATVGSTAVAGTHSISVANLASTSSAYTDPVTASFTLTPGSFTLQVGSNQPATVSINTTGVTVAQLATYINTSNFGVTASVQQNADGTSTLGLVSNTTGSPGNITISGGSAVGLTFNQVAGNDANLTVDGVPTTSATNTVSSAIPGVTLSLLAPTGSTPAQLTVGTDSTQAVQAVNNFVAAYNTLISEINQQYVVDPATNNEGPLGSDISVRSLQSSLLNDAAYAVTGNDGYVNLASLGINTNNDGTLTVDSTTLNNALSSDPSAFQNFFQNASLTGFANNFNNDLTNLTDPTAGVLNADLAQNTAQQQSLTTDITNFQTNLTAEQQSLTAQYDSVNASLESYPLLLQAVTEVLGSLGTTVSSTTGATIPGSPTLTAGL